MPDTATVSHAKLDSFFSGLQAKLDALKHVQELYEPQLATRFSAFQWIDLNENGLSAQLAYFLDPRQTHAQGDKFLRVFLEYVSEKLKKGDSKREVKFLADGAEVFTEYLTKEGRWIDLVIKLQEVKEVKDVKVDGKVKRFIKPFTIGIENKIWATDQPDQLQDYITELDENIEGDYLLIYLTPRIRDYSELSISAKDRDNLEKSGHLMKMTYVEDFGFGFRQKKPAASGETKPYTIFERWVQVCDADKVRWYLKDLNTYLLQQKFGEQTMEERDEMLTYIKDNPTLQTTIFSVLLDADYLLDSLIKEQVVQLCDYIKKQVDFTIGKIEIPDSIKVKQGGFYFYVEGWKHFCIGFEFEGANFNNCYYGLCTIEDSDQKALEYAE